MYSISNVCFHDVALLKGGIDVRVHDEAYAKVHLGFVGINYDFFVARICFKGGAHYELNILKVVLSVSRHL